MDCKMHSDFRDVFIVLKKMCLRIDETQLAGVIL